MTEVASGLRIFKIIHIKKYKSYVDRNFCSSIAVNFIWLDYVRNYVQNALYK